MRKLKLVAWFTALLASICVSAFNYASGHYFLVVLGMIFAVTLGLVKPNGRQ